MGPKPREAQSAAWKRSNSSADRVVRRVGNVATAPVTCAVICFSAQLVGLSVKSTAIELEANVADPHRDSLEDLGEGIGRCGPPGRYAGRRRAAVRTAITPRSIGPDHGGADHDDAQRGALVGAGEIDLAGDIGERNADAGADVGGADEARRPGRRGRAAPARRHPRRPLRSPGRFRRPGKLPTPANFAARPVGQGRGRAGRAPGRRPIGSGGRQRASRSRPVVERARFQSRDRKAVRRGC